MMEFDPSSSVSRPGNTPGGAPGAWRSGAVGRIITDAEVVSRTLDRAPMRIPVDDAARARLLRSEMRRALFAAAGELDQGERALANARSSGDPSAIREWEGVVRERAARVSELAERANGEAPTPRDALTPERVLSLLAWRRERADGTG
ncbi:MAG: hypothetical protein ACTS3F_02900 [Phycisphaerales bacterium]